LTPKTVYLVYASGAVRGNSFYDTVDLGYGLKVTNQAMALVDETADLAGYTADGVMGTWKMKVQGQDDMYALSRFSSIFQR